MLDDARRIRPGASLRSDVCVVGAGAAGIAAALELGRRGHGVLLLEAGGLRDEAAPRDALRGGVVSPDEGSGIDTHPALETTRQRRLGGTTGTWGGRCVPLDPIDFERRRRAGESGWPITFDDLEPFYRVAQKYCEAGNFEYSTEEALPGAPPFLVPEGATTRLHDRKLLRYSRPTDFGSAYRPMLRESRRIRVLHHANVVSLEFEEDGKSLGAARVASDPGREFRVEARHYVLAGGGLESTRLLLVSERDSGLRVGPGHDLLGRFYMTHLDGYVGTIRFSGLAPRPAFSYERSRDGVFCRRLLSLTPETLRREGLLNFSAVLHPPRPEDPTHGDALLSAYALAKETVKRLRLGLKGKRALQRAASGPIGPHVRNLMSDPGRLGAFSVRWVHGRWLASRKVPSFLTDSPSGAYRFLFSAEQSPSRASTVALADERDAWGVPRLEVRWRASPADEDSILRTLSAVSEEVHSLGVGRATVPSSVDELRAEIGGGFLGGTHAMGTARMSASPRMGVVDAHCRVHGVPNLHVASSAVFPTSSFAAPTLTIVALAVRVARRISAELGGR